MSTPVTPADNTDKKSGGLGPAVVSAVVGALLGGALIFGAASALYQTELPEAEAITQDQALLGGPEYGER
ncbi:DUF2613 domain-containing protein [Corynebacterium sp. TAE3-ERU12]|uniref:DUF2613 domain-containing protein n=1 Tax=Corynebacterium sp. TAE3-ERU12 TaxID=2849491 RepID=UPI001C44F677|nr:DUF2613 domain-containing protein [Corynebacterium sp. TAE3-ERU12]MBV7296032.1 DUF2613 domain-containing protein [Corynebacterium sp. TAE3-ERU12]